MTHPTVTIQVNPVSVPSTPSWMGEIAAFAQVMAHLGLLQAIQEHIRFARARFGTYDTIDFVVVLISYALSGERALKAFYERLVPFADPFMALWTRAFARSLDALSFSCSARLRECRGSAHALSRRSGGPNAIRISWWLVGPPGKPVVDHGCGCHQTRGSPTRASEAERSACPSSSSEPGVRAWLHRTQAGRSRVDFHSDPPRNR